MEENIVKATAKRLGMTYRELAEATGYSEDGIKKAAAADKVSEPMQKALELLEKNRELETQANETKQLKELLKNFIS